MLCRLCVSTIFSPVPLAVSPPPLFCVGGVREEGEAAACAAEDEDPLDAATGPLLVATAMVEEEEEEASCAGRSKLLSPILSSSSRVERSSKQSWTPPEPAAATVVELAIDADTVDEVREELLQTGSAMEEGLQLLSAWGWLPWAPFS